MTFPFEIITFLGSGVMTYLGKYLENRAKERKEMFDMAMAKHQALETSFDAASKRYDNDAGKKNRRAIVQVLLFAVVVAPFLLALGSFPIFVEVETQRREFLFGLIGGGTRTEFIPINGFPILSVVTNLFAVVGGSYFGKAVTK